MIVMHRDEQIRELRYVDGLTCIEVAAIFGLTRQRVGQIAPGRPGKVSNEKVRELFNRSVLSASEVARRMGWVSGHSVDASRVLRALGLRDETCGRGRLGRRVMIDAEMAMGLAEAMGHEGWEALPDES